MEELIVKATHKTPEIKGDLENGQFTIKGVCIPEDARDFFVPFKDWLLELMHSDTGKIQAELHLEYFNTSTSSILLDIFKQLNKLTDEKEISITWSFDEDDLEMEEVGMDYQLILGENFKLNRKSAN
ncbi:MAG: DUF1987 domain-containing protein [Crocinitomicaceae bacterium]|nr:DUF1987 domain-containing protein [Crocinitomicaceae bacterium]